MVTNDPMGTSFHFLVVLPDRSTKYNTLIDACSACIEGTDKTSGVIKCPYYREERRLGRRETRDGASIFLCTNRDHKSSKVFAQYITAVLDAVRVAATCVREQTERVNRSFRDFVHNVTTLNTQSSQELYSIFPEEIFRDDRRRFMQAVAATVNGRTNDVSQLIVNIAKNHRLVKNEFFAYRKASGEVPLRLDYGIIHPIIRLVLNVYYVEFGNRSIRVDLGDSYMRVTYDYELLASCLIYIVDNASKYTMSESTLSISFGTVCDTLQVRFSMTSMKIESSEMQSIFDHGISGLYPKQTGRSGSGIGLCRAKQYMQAMGGDLLYCPPTTSEHEHLVDGVPYVYNTFILVFSMEDQS